MAHPYKSAAHTKDPSWLRGVKKFVEKADKADVKDTVRNYGSDPVETAKASYVSKEKK